MEFLPGSSPARLLTPEEIETLKPVFDEHGGRLPDPAVSFFVGCVEDGEVVAFVCMQLMIHAQPLYIKPGHEAKFRGMARLAERTIAERTNVPCNVYVFAEPGQASDLAIAAGMTTENWVVLSKHIDPKAALAIEPVAPLPAQSSESEESKEAA